MGIPTGLVEANTKFGLASSAFRGGHGLGAPPPLGSASASHLSLVIGGLFII